MLHIETLTKMREMSRNPSSEWVPWLQQEEALSYAISAIAERDTLKTENATECIWELEDDEFGGPWTSQCGVNWSFEDGSPEDNGVKFCVGCGKRVRTNHPDQADYDPHLYDDAEAFAAIGGKE